MLNINEDEKLTFYFRLLSYTICFSQTFSFYMNFIFFEILESNYDCM